MSTFFIKLEATMPSRAVRKLTVAEWSEHHSQVLQEAQLTNAKHLQFPETGWSSLWLGAGEEKAVFLVIDPQDRAFALEVIDERRFMGGKLVEGTYFAEFTIPGIAEFEVSPGRPFSQIYTGKVKAREFIVGDVWADWGRCWFERLPAWKAFLMFLPLSIFSGIGILLAGPKRNYLQKQWDDAHDANLAIEMLPLSNPERKDHYPLPLLYVDYGGKCHLCWIRLTPIDVRPLSQKARSR